MLQEKYIFKVVYGENEDGTEQKVEFSEENFSDLIVRVATSDLYDKDFVAEVYSIIEEKGERGPSSPLGYLSKKGLVFTDEFD